MRIEEARAGNAAWEKWSPHLTERQWGTDCGVMSGSLRADLGCFLRGF